MMQAASDDFAQPADYRSLNAPDRRAHRVIQVANDALLRINQG